MFCAFICRRLLLPFECHLTGKQVNLVPRTPPKHFLYANYNKEQDDGQGPPKRRLLSVPLLQVGWRAADLEKVLRTGRAALV